LRPTIHFQSEAGGTLALEQRLGGRFLDGSAPWGTDQRPHLFEEPIIVTLNRTAASLRLEIRYTTDDTEPTPDSHLYSNT
jgi:hypothetical protein